MKTSLALLGMLLCTAPLSAGNPARRVVAACELTTATVIPSGNESETQGREFAIRVTNSSSRTVAVPRSPNFGWRVETQGKDGWRLKAEGGAVRRLSANDPHIVVVSDKVEDLALVKIAPAHGETFLTYMPEAQKELQPIGQFSRNRLVLYWAANAELARNPTVLPCGLAAEWVVNMQKLPTPK